MRRKQQWNHWKNKKEQIANFWAETQPQLQDLREYARERKGRGMTEEEQKRKQPQEKEGNGIYIYIYKQEQMPHEYEHSLADLPEHLQVILQGEYRCVCNLWTLRALAAAGTSPGLPRKVVELPRDEYRYKRYL
jgi:hypothetical protein